ncbi:hypothetical protein ACFW91_25110 [Streptomyces asoensis]|uniref:hypothetical protein n=1 Tax=Streptomyces asoensis TaxID=249586 RepID=UPI0036794F30
MTSGCRIPSPADLAHRKPQPPATDRPAAKRREPKAQAPSRPQPVDGMATAADAVRQGRLHKGEAFRAFFEQGVRISNMTPHTRLTALTLLGYANFNSGEIHPRWRPGAEKLAIATGLTVDQVRVQLDILTSRGWLGEFALTSGPRAGQLCLQLGVPAAVLQQLRDRAGRRAAGDKPPNA